MLCPYGAPLREQLRLFWYIWLVFILLRRRLVRSIGDPEVYSLKRIAEMRPIYEMLLGCRPNLLEGLACVVLLRLPLGLVSVGGNPALIGQGCTYRVQVGRYPFCVQIALWYARFDLAYLAPKIPIFNLVGRVVAAL